MTTKDKISQITANVSGDYIKLFVKRATTREDTVPKPKHIKQLINLIKRNDKSNVTKLVEYLRLRIQKPSCVISYKALYVVHILFNLYNSSFQLQFSTRLQHCNLQKYVNSQRLTFNMSFYVKKYAQYIIVKAESYRVLGFDISQLKPDDDINFEKREKIFQEMRQILSLCQTIIDNKIDFSNDSFLVRTVQTYLYEEFHRLYFNLSRRIIIIIENIKNLFACEAVELIEIYSSFIQTHSWLAKYKNEAIMKNLEICENFSFIQPQESFIIDLKKMSEDLPEKKNFILGSQPRKSKNEQSDLVENKISVNFRGVKMSQTPAILASEAMRNKGFFSDNLESPKKDFVKPHSVSMSDPLVFSPKNPFNDPRDEHVFTHNASTDTSAKASTVDEEPPLIEFSSFQESKRCYTLSKNYPNDGLFTPQPLRSNDISDEVFMGMQDGKNPFKNNYNPFYEI